jgi:hypothetical protein
MVAVLVKGANMADRELLELAAKAAGITAEWHEEFGIEYSAANEGMWLKGERSPDNSKYWNPLTVDGDAFRLACALELQIDIVGDGMCEVTSQRFMARIWEHDTPEYDTARALRRAITRAAAEIGKLTP